MNTGLNSIAILCGQPVLVVLYWSIIQHLLQDKLLREAHDREPQGNNEKT